MSVDFDTKIPLRNTHSLKYDMMEKVCGVGDPDALSMWVADMDFKPPQAVHDALQAEIDRGLFCYFGDDSTTRSAICDWMADQHGWRFEPDRILFSHGVVAGLSITLEAFSDPDDSVILFTPVYHAFARKIKAMGRLVHECPMPIEDGAYVMDLDGLRRALTPRHKILIFCSPHNPGGKIWTADEIRALAAFCAEHNLILVSDEIHMDLTFPGQRHVPTAIAAPECSPRLVTLTAASKGFNLAGGETGFIIAEDPAVLARLTKAHLALGGTPNRFGMIMTEAALRHGAQWSRDVRAYIAGNFSLFRDGVNAIPGVSVMDMPSTYLAWVDFAGTGMTANEVSDRVAKMARIATSAGPSFGAGGETFKRFNLAMPRAMVLEAVTRLQHAFSDLQ